MMAVHSAAQRLIYTDTGDPVELIESHPSPLGDLMIRLGGLSGRGRGMTRARVEDAATGRLVWRSSDLPVKQALAMARRYIEHLWR